MSASTFFPDSSPSSSPDLYAVLSLSRDPSPSESDIKLAYRRAALLFHPDKLPTTATPEEIEQGNLKFQQVGFAYGILKDEKKRERYDKTGNTDEGEVLRSEAEWKDYFKELWKGEVNADTIEDFRVKYQGSDEERSDLLAAYTQHKGSLEPITNAIMCSTVSDEDRFITIINSAISSGEIDSLPAWKKSLKDTKGKEKRVKNAAKEAKEAEEYAKELGVHDKLFGGKKAGKGKGKKENDEDSLKALIQGNQAKRMDAMMESLEAKYGNGKGKQENKKGKRKVEEEPTEEEFERIRKEIDEKRKAKPSDHEGPAKKSKKSK